MFAVVAARVRDAITRTATAVRATAREVLRPAPLVTGFTADLFRSHEELVAENTMLRQ